MRLELTRKTDLALRALRHLEREGGRVKAAALADAVGTTAGFLNQAMKPVVTAGWATSAVGPRGGYELAAAAGPSVLDLVQAVEGPVEDGRCVLQDAACPRPAPCALHDAWIQARTALQDVLAATPAIPAAPAIPAPTTTRTPTALHDPRTTRRDDPR